MYQDIASGISFEKHKQFFNLLEENLAYQVGTVIITYKDRLSRVRFDLFHYLFRQFGTEIVIMSEVGSPKLDTVEIFEEIMALLYCYTMKMYSNRRSKRKLELIMTALRGKTKNLATS
jgi:predicted site-specific integrase-resolvase